LWRRVRVGGNRFEEGRGGGAGQIRLEGIQVLLVEPVLDHLLQVGGRVQRDRAVTEHPRSQLNGHINDSWEDMLSCEGGEV
jgi:hypothetical protein